MPIQSKAAVIRRYGEPLAVEDVELLDPGPEELVVKIEASGVCHSDLSLARGYYPDIPIPIVPGHEGSGIVVEVGEDVESLKKGDKVFTIWMASCLGCEYCLSGRFHLCQNALKAIVNASLPSGELKIRDRSGNQIHHFTSTAALASHIVVHEKNVVKLTLDVPLDKVAILGCAVLTGVGAALKTAGVREGSSVAVIGLGGVGMNIIQGARLAGAEKIIAIDLYDSKLEWAVKFGATHLVNAAREDPAEAVKKITGDGVDYAFEATGSVKAMELAYKLTRRGGVVTIVGVERGGVDIRIPALDLHMTEKTIKGCYYGSSSPRLDALKYLSLYKAGKLMLDELVTRSYRLEEINDVFRDMEEGRIIRGVVKP
ncbi:MAG: Zn-dependent alcohol dehydrogenase [Nitrososphaerota archaeon]|nr:Zn-dependent alcohol dehydrogenase [Candidatus Calditenuaceae archaeon]MDW8073430.1 Zn-dependent alcohol dehydrogenase [Nitrososphaerota archaeon]